MKKKLSDHFNPRKNLFYEKHAFRQVRQEEGESIASYATRLRNLAKHCDFHDVNREIIGKIVEGSNSKDVISKILRSSNDLKLEELLDWGRTREVADHQIKDITKGAENYQVVNRVSSSTGKVEAGYAHHARKCYKCGMRYPHDGDCPAKNKKCNRCCKSGHF